MRFQIVEHFLNRQVEITLRTRKSFSGVLRISDLDSGAIELEPTGSYDSKRYGAVIVMAEDIVTIRPIIAPQMEDDCDEICEKSCDLSPHNDAKCDDYDNVKMPAEESA